jgi:PTH1 family peptidyl-tRNA hydrolase
MLLWVGLGNPEPGMARQRHNIGFMALDRIAERHGFGPWRPRFKGLLAEGRIGDVKVLALKPMTYMNASGQSVQAALAFFKLEPQVVTVFHDELDLIPGKVRVKRGGGAAGHNGLRSIDQMLGTPEYGRVRLGIGHPGHKGTSPPPTAAGFCRSWMRWPTARRRSPQTGRKTSCPASPKTCGRYRNGVQLRHRRPAQCRQVDSVQRADGHRRRPGRELPLLHHRAQCRPRRGAG